MGRFPEEIGLVGRDKINDIITFRAKSAVLKEVTVIVFNRVKTEGLHPSAQAALDHHLLARGQFDPGFAGNHLCKVVVI